MSGEDYGWQVAYYPKGGSKAVIGYGRTLSIAAGNCAREAAARLAAANEQAETVEEMVAQLRESGLA